MTDVINYDLFADRAASTDDAEALLTEAMRVANQLLEWRGSFTVGEVRLQLEREGLLENAGREKLDALGVLGRRMNCVVIGRERQPAALGVTHGNLGARWARRPAA